MQDYSFDTNSTGTSILSLVVFDSRLEYIMNCLTAGCSQHVPEAYLELVFAPTPLYELQAFRQALGPFTFVVQCGFPTTISSVSRGVA